MLFFSGKSMKIYLRKKKIEKTRMLLSFIALDSSKQNSISAAFSYEMILRGSSINMFKISNQIFIIIAVLRRSV